MSAMRVFLDAGILFSAVQSDGAALWLVSLLLDRGHECRVDACGVAESRRNLVKKGRLAVQLVDALLTHLQITAAVWGAVQAAELDWRPSKDRPELAAAIRPGCDALVAGDRKHFGSAFGLQVSGATILSPRSPADAALA